MAQLQYLITSLERPTAAMTCCSKDPSIPPSLVFPEAIGPSQEENIIGSVESFGAVSRTCCRYAPYALIVVLGSFFFISGSNGSRSARDTCIFRIWRILPLIGFKTEP